MSALLLWAWVFPLPGLLLTALGVGRGVASLGGPLAIGLLAAAWLLAGGQPVEYRVPDWLPFLPDGAFHLRADALSIAMLAVVGLVSFCIYVYSLGYMTVDDGHGNMVDDPAKARFFAYLDFFVASMALLVLAGNLAVLLIGWSGVGLASFLLISFYHGREGYHVMPGGKAPLPSGLDALAANAVGDGALLLAVVLVPGGCGDLARLQARECLAGPGGATMLAWLVLIAAAAKSAQGPLYFWIPTAMAGPTPVSALIHAATMVAAGVYLLVRTFPLLELAPAVLQVTAWVGALTAVVAGVMSLQQDIFKRGLAYSTISQLGYMFAAVGFAAPFAAFFHLVTHAAFKALLFLTAGVVIHATGEELLSRLGGLRRRLLWAYAGFWIGALALAGIPVVTAGAFSKDLVLEAGLSAQPLLGGLLLVGVFLTGLYVFRLLFGVFHGPLRTPMAHEGPHGGEAEPGVMRWPLVPLMIGSLVLGYLEVPSGWFSHLLALGGHAETHQVIGPIGLLAGALALVGLAVAWFWHTSTGFRARLGGPAWSWTAAVASSANGLAGWLAGRHSGKLGGYALASIVGLALLVLVGVLARWGMRA